jgi:hypothetical protein
MKKFATALFFVVILVLSLTNTASAKFGIAEFTAKSSTSQAAAHPDFTTNIQFPVVSDKGPPFGIADGNVRDISVELPPGLIGDPSSVPQCPQALFITKQCPIESEVGVAHTLLNLGPYETPFIFFDNPVFNMEPRNSDTVAELAFYPVFVTVHLSISLRSDGDYGLNTEVIGAQDPVSFGGTEVKIWGVPGDPGHDSERLEPGCSFGCATAPPGIYPRVPFFTNPTGCGPVSARAVVNSYQEPTVFHEAGTSLPPITGCDKVKFEPELEARPTTNVADAPSGLDVDITMPQNEEPDELATAHLRDASVTLPEGLTVNPSSANGLDACSPAQMGLTTTVGDSNPHFNKAATECPAASAIGSTEVITPAYDDALHGRVFLATPHQNPFGSLLALYATVKGHGINVKLAGEVHADPKTGQITSTFANNPQLPVEHFRLHLFKGALAPLKTPTGCDTYTTTSSLTPWSAPESGPPATPSDTYAINQGAGGQPCGAAKNAPSFEAGVADPTAGAYSPFVLNLSRQDGSQGFGDISATLPPGLLAKLAGTPPCSDAALAAAAGKTGAAEQASPSCPAASRIGSVQVAAGAGPQPFHAPGSVYLAGPYKGAPLSLAIVTPAVAGPFDLGTVVVRNAVRLDPDTAQVSAVSDPIPSILAGIPLDIRSVSLRLDKPQFTRTPTSCDPMQVTGSLTSLLGQAASLTDRFQVGDCPRLGFKPKLKLALKGKVARRSHPSLRATLTARPGDANIASAQVKLPPSVFLDQAHIGTVCTRVQFAAQACPARAIYGKAVATSPLLDYPVGGPVYLRSSNHKLPDLVADLRGPASQPIEVALAGKTDAVKGALRNTFEAVPDVPVTKFSLTLFGGKKGLIIMSDGFCARPRATAEFGAQNGKVSDSKPKVAAKCGKHKKKKK